MAALEVRYQPMLKRVQDLHNIVLGPNATPDDRENWRVAEVEMQTIDNELNALREQRKQLEAIRQNNAGGDPRMQGATVEGQKSYTVVGDVKWQGKYLLESDKVSTGEAVRKAGVEKAKDNTYLTLIRRREDGHEVWNTHSVKGLAEKQGADVELQEDDTLVVKEVPATRPAADGGREEWNRTVLEMEALAVQRNQIEFQIAALRLKLAQAEKDNDELSRKSTQQQIKLMEARLDENSRAYAELRMRREALH